MIVSIDDTHTILNSLQNVVGATDVRRVHQFYMARAALDQTLQEIDIQILESRDTLGLASFSVLAKVRNSDLRCSGSSHGDLAMALASVHWGDLDK